MSDGLSTLPTRLNPAKTDVRLFAASSALGFFLWQFVAGNDPNEAATVGGLTGTFFVGARHVTTRLVNTIYGLTPKSRERRYFNAREQLRVVFITLVQMGPDNFSPTVRRLWAEISALNEGVMDGQILDPKVIEDVLKRWESTFYGPDLFIENGGQDEIVG